jgi:hypothetical protein
MGRENAGQKVIKEKGDKEWSVPEMAIAHPLAVEMLRLTVLWFAMAGITSIIDAAMNSWRSVAGQHDTFLVNRQFMTCHCCQ